MLNLKALLTKILSCPMVIDHGVRGIWHWRKWSDGTAECWGTWSSASVTHYGQQFGGYAYNSGTINFPSGLFKATPIVNYSGYIGNSFFLTGTHTLNSVSKDGFVAYVLTAVSGAQSMIVYIHVIGQWQ